MDRAVRDYAVVTLAYWGFTLTDGALRMLVLLHFHQLGYSPLQLASLFLLYELCGVVTNLLGGWIASRSGLRPTLIVGLALQVGALVLLSTLDPNWSRAVAVPFVMAAQALSGIAKDLTKMSAKSAIKVLVPPDRSSTLFRWVAVLTGSKNALKGAGFFLGGVLLAAVGFRHALWAMAGGLALIGALTGAALPRSLGRPRVKVPLRAILSKSSAVNRLSLARLFLFGARDIWFVVAVPVYMADALGWSFGAIGAFFAVWVMAYGGVQGASPWLLARVTARPPGAGGAALLGVILAATAAIIPLAAAAGAPAAVVILGGLGAFGVAFALNSAVHSYLILAYAGDGQIAADVGFYYMANAAGRLMGTLLSGLVFQLAGLHGALWASAAAALVAGVLAARLPRLPDDDIAPGSPKADRTG